MNHKLVQQVLQDHFLLTRQHLAGCSRFKIDKRRLDFIARFITALLQVCTVNSTILSTALSSNQIESNARRIKRFLQFDLPQANITQFVLAFVSDEKFVLTMDHTN